MVYLTFAAEFNAIHKLWNSILDDAENIKMFGECANEAGHGHLYRFEITVAAEVASDKPVVLERMAIRNMIESVLAPKLRHGNMDTAFGIDNFVSTGENVAMAVWRLVGPQIPKDVSLVSVKVIETPKNSFVYFGERGPQKAWIPMA
jgi:6-pyruvoyltetrahydropterin/6-carboxytetrahydropterin synthase